MGFLDELFKKEPTPEEQRVQWRMALRRAQREVAELTAEYADLWEAAKQYLKAGNKDMAEQAAWKCCKLKPFIARREAWLEKLQHARRLVGEKSSPALINVLEKPVWIDDEIKSLISEGDAALSDEEQFARRECVENLLRKLEEELAEEAGAADGNPRDEAADRKDADPEATDPALIKKLLEELATDPARLKKLMEEFK